MNRLEDALNDMASSGITPMHMPGHKRNPDLIPSYLQNDITEIPGFDDLHAPSGIIKDIEHKASSLWNARSAVLSVNGATAPILASIMAASSKGKVLIASNCHISVWHALELAGCTPVLIDPVTDPSVSFCLSVDPDSVDRVLTEDPDIKTVVITSPTYEGVISDIKSIYKITQAHKAALIVDESHGAHFGLNEMFPETSVADVVIKSIHKTLHAPTQTAILLTYSDTVREDLIRHYMDVFESSSPSYILMSGIDRVVSDLTEDRTLTYSWAEALYECRAKLKTELKHIKLFEKDNTDPSKLVILTGNVISGSTLAQRLRTEGIETEASFDTHLIAMTGIGDTKASLELFEKALLSIDNTLEGSVTSFKGVLPTEAPDIVMSVREAVTSDCVELPKAQCEGKISACYKFKYPPGIPIIIPGQRITKERLALVPGDSVKVIRG